MRSADRTPELLLVGPCAIDIVISVDSYPVEDTKGTVSKPTIIRAGGNCGTASRMLGQLAKYVKRDGSVCEDPVDEEDGATVDRVPRIALISPFAGLDASK